ncbi:energy transducer TonB [Stenotrophomonas sp. LARHCG68]
MVRTQHRVPSLHIEPSRIFAYSTALALHVLAAGLLLIPLSQVPVRSDAVREPRWQVPDTKPIEPPPPIPPTIPVSKTPAPPKQPALPAPVETAPMPVFPTEAVITAPVDVAPVADPAPAIDSIAPATPLQGVQLRYERAPAPTYPIDALRAGIEGTVLLRVLVGQDGKPLEVSIERSSGNRSLDNAARTQVLRRWQFQPATDGGHAVQAYGIIPIDFKVG